MRNPMDTIRTKAHLVKLIADGIEESAGLEYKGAGALDKSDQKKRDITKDVSAFANSAGGTIIYGIKESSGSNPPRLPEALKPIDCRKISKEWLDQIIGQIRPRVRGVEISAIKVGSSAADYVYVVEIPQSSTAHQALDLRYYSRRNFESTAMEDFEIRDVLHRVIHPTLDVLLRILEDYPMDENSSIAVQVRNVGAVMARHWAVVLRLPIRFSSGIIFPEDAFITTGDQACWTVSVGNGIGAPLFPGSDVVKTQKFKHVRELDPSPGKSIKQIEVTVYADNMPKVEFTRAVIDAERATSPRVLSSVEFQSK